MFQHCGFKMCPSVQLICRSESFGQEIRWTEGMSSAFLPIYIMIDLTVRVGVRSNRSVWCRFRSYIFSQGIQGPGWSVLICAEERPRGLPHLQHLGRKSGCLVSAPGRLFGEVFHQQDQLLVDFFGFLLRSHRGSVGMRWYEGLYRSFPWGATLHQSINQHPIFLFF